MKLKTLGASMLLLGLASPGASQNNNYQEGFDKCFNGLSAKETTSNNTFNIARLEYASTHNPIYYKNWFTDCPEADYLIVEATRRLTGIDVGARPLRLRAADPAIFSHPFIYSTEPGYMNLNSLEASVLREYLTRGGFWFIDDFWGEQEWLHFIAEMKKIFPGINDPRNFDGQKNGKITGPASSVALVELKKENEVFRFPLPINEILSVPVIANIQTCTIPEECEKTPAVYGLLDLRGRIMVIASFQSDDFDGLEWQDDPSYPEKYSSYAIRLIVNAIHYALTH